VDWVWAHRANGGPPAQPGAELKLGRRWPCLGGRSRAFLRSLTGHSIDTLPAGSKGGGLNRVSIEPVKGQEARLKVGQTDPIRDLTAMG